MTDESIHTILKNYFQFFRFCAHRKSVLDTLFMFKAEAETSSQQKLPTKTIRFVFVGSLPTFPQICGKIIVISTS